MDFALVRNDGESVSHWHLSEPILQDMDFGPVEYVAVSTLRKDSGFVSVDETYIFPIDKDGYPLDLCELPGSVNKVADHYELMMNFAHNIAPRIKNNVLGD